MWRLQLALEWEETSERGWGPFRHINRRLRVTPQHLRRSGLSARWDGSVGCQPSFHWSGAGQLSLPCVSRRPLESGRQSLSPTGFTRTPLVARSPRNWKENPAPSVGQPRPTSTFFGDLTSQTVPCELTKGPRFAWPPLGLLFAKPTVQPNAATSAFTDRARPVRLGRRLACAGRRCPGQGPHHPVLREEIQNPLHPRCLPPMSYCGIESKAFAWVDLLVGYCPQLVANLGTILGATFWTPSYPDGLDGPRAKKPSSSFT